MVPLKITPGSASPRCIKGEAFKDYQERLSLPKNCVSEEEPSPNKTEAVMEDIIKEIFPKRDRKKRNERNGMSPQTSRQESSKDPSRTG